MKNKKHISLMNIEFVQNRFDKNNMYLNTYIRCNDCSTFIINLKEDEDMFTKHAYDILRSYILPEEKDKLFHKVSSPYKTNYFAISNSIIRTAAEMKKSLIKKSFKRPLIKCEYDSSVLTSNVNANCPYYNESIRQSTINSIYKYYHKMSDYKIYRTITINRAAHYVNGVDDNTDKFDANSVYLYVNEKNAYAKILTAIANYNATQKSAQMHKVTNTLYDIALAYFIIGKSHTESELNIDTIMFIISSILCYAFDGSSEVNNWINGVSWKSLETKVKKLVEKSCQDGFEYEAKRLASVFGSINKCRFPEGWTIEEQKKWKAEHNVIRKDRKDIDRNKVVEMSQNGYKVKDILSMFKISKRTYYNIVNSNTNNTNIINNSFNYTNKYTFFKEENWNEKMLEEMIFPKSLKIPIDKKNSNFSAYNTELEFLNWMYQINNHK